jgi:hypothetical protein
LHRPYAGNKSFTKLPALLKILVKTWPILKFLGNAFRFCFRTTGLGFLALIGAISFLFFLSFDKLMVFRTEICQSLKQKDLAQSRTNGNFFIILRYK